MMDRRWFKVRRALVLSGGGCRGAFEVGALLYLMVEKGYDFHIFLGTSVGALNVAILGQCDIEKHRLAAVLRLKELWLSIRGNRDIYSGGLGIPWRFLRQGTLFEPRGLRRIMERHVDIDRLFGGNTVVKVSAVALETGELFYADTRDATLRDVYRDYILASASIPWLFPAVIIQGKHWYDGGLRDMTPLGAVFQEEPDEIVVIVTNQLSSDYRPILPPFTPGGPVQNISRSLDILLSEISANDLQLAEAINRLPKGVGQRRVPIRVIAPKGPLMGRSALDFDPYRIRENIRRGYEAAKTPWLLDGGIRTIPS